MKIGPALWEELADTLGGSVIGHPDGKPVDFEYLATDSRTLHAGSEALERTVFIALRGPRHDGHAHVHTAAQQGVKGFIIAQDWTGSLPDSHVLRVPDTLAALQALGAAARKARTGQVVGITGSNGKTTVKEWARALAPASLHTSRSPGSWNSQVGVPLALWGLDDHADLHLVEAGISLPGEMDALASIIHPNIGVMTHFGDAHDAHFASRAEKAREKARLFSGCSSIILGTHDPDILKALQDIHADARCVHWAWPEDQHPGLGTLALNITDIALGADHSRMTGLWRGHAVQWTLPFTEKAHLANALTSALLILEITGDLEGVTARLAHLRPLGMRLEHLSGTGGGTIINDTWNHDLDGLSTALEALERLGDRRKKAVVLSDIVPFDRNDEGQFARLRHTLALREVDRWIAVGPQLSHGIPGIDPDAIQHYATTEELLDSAALDGLQGWNVLVKGARPFAFERVARALEANPHTTVFDLDLGRLAHNLQLHRDQIGRPIMGMVKAFAYGAGDAVAVELDRLGIERLAVAFAEEGIALRKAGVRCPIMVLNADPQRFTDLLAWHLEPEVHNLITLKQWGHALLSAAPSDGHSRGVHLKVETGMHRLGLGTEEAATAGSQCAEMGIPIISVYSHLSAADDPAADHHTQQQIDQYVSACEDIRKGWEAAGSGPLSFIQHLANTAGAARFPQARFDMVRIGLGLYGLDASGTTEGLLPIGRFHTRISHIHDVPPGEAVGYGAKDKSGHPRRIATLPVGYADGLPRAAGMGKASLFAGGRKCPTVGPVCMDGCMIDITGLEVQVGDSVEVFGDHAAIEDLAAATDTIPYEILCRIPQRVRRRHLRT
jgi:alanine racemase